MKSKIHPLSAMVATLCIAAFLISTILVETFGSGESVAMTKRLIVVPGLFVLIPAMAIVGGTGFSIAKKRVGRVVDKKRKRMPLIAANGLLVLTPCAIALNHWASTGSFDTTFYIIQGIELLAGSINLTLMGISVRDGLKLSGKLKRNANR